MISFYPTSNTSVSTNYVDSSGISAGNSVVYKVFAQNAFATSSASTTSDSVTTPSGTSWGSISGFNMHLETGGASSQTLESGEKSSRYNIRMNNDDTIFFTSSQLYNSSLGRVTSYKYKI